MSPFATAPVNRCANGIRTGCDTLGRNIQRSCPFSRMIWPRSEAGSVIMTTVLSTPFDRTRYFLASLVPLAVVVLIVTVTSKPSEGNRTWSAFCTIDTANASSFGDGAFGGWTLDGCAFGDKGSCASRTDELPTSNARAN